MVDRKFRVVARDWSVAAILVGTALILAAMILSSGLALVAGFVLVLLSLVGVVEAA